MNKLDKITKFAIENGYDGAYYVGSINDINYYKTKKKSRNNGGYIGSPSIIGYTKDNYIYVVDDFSDERYGVLKKLFV